MNDLRFALRKLLKQPGFTAVAVLTLAIGIGANSALFSLVNTVLLSPLPFENPERLVMVRETDLANDIDDGSVSGPNFIDLRDGSRSFEAMTACEFGGRLNLSGRGEPLALQVAFVTPAFNDVFGTPILHGRVARREDAESGYENRVVLSHRVWQTHFGSDSNVVGQTITLDGRPHEVVGVAAPQLGFIEELVEVYAPLPNTRLRANRGNHYLQVFGRLKPGVTAEQAQAELATIMAAVGEAHPDQKGRSVRLDSLHERLVGTVRPAFLVLYSAVALVLFIACANVGSLLLARSETRAREIAVRATLGAGRARIVRQLLTESVVLSLVGAVLGLGFAQGGLRLLPAIAPKLQGRSIPFIDELAIDARVLGLTLVVAFATGLAFGVVPVWHLLRRNLVDTLKESSRGSSASQSRQRTLGVVVVFQCAVTVVLLITAGVLLQNFRRLSRVHPGFEADAILTLTTELSNDRHPDAASRGQFYDQVLREMRSLPGVEAAEVINLVPMSEGDSGWSFDIQGAEPLPPGRYRLAEYRLVTPGFFAALRIPLRHGRSFTPADDGRSAGVVVVSQALVERYLNGVDAVGRRIRFGQEAPLLEIVGVVDDVKHFGLGSEVRPTIYQPITQDCWPEMSFVIRTSSKPGFVARAAQEAIWRVNPQLPVTGVRPLQQLVRDSISVQLFSALLLLGFSVVGLLLAAIGIYGVQAYLVTQRTHEIGLRLALGAPVPGILRWVMGRGMRLTAVGLVVGLLGAVAASRLLEGLLHEMSALDPTTFTAVPLILGGVALLASWLPARRASRVDPMVALRNE